MGTWNSRGLRGSALEELINHSNEKYRNLGLALRQKVPTPITPVKMGKNSGQISLAYFNEKSTVDYIGVVQGIPVCFDAKECSSDTFPVHNIHEHQVKFMQDFERQGGIAFIIADFVGHNEIFYIPYNDIIKFWNRAKEGGRKSFTYEEINKQFKIRSHNGIMVHYIEMIQKDLDMRVE